MGKKYKHIVLKIIAAVVLLAVTAIAATWYLHDKNIQVLNAAGPIAGQQRSLLIFASLLSLFVVIPVFVLTFWIAWNYRATNKKARYEPEWDGDTAIEALWWGIPLVLIIILSLVTWRTSHSLDPFRPIASDQKPLEVQVVALQWKWLFIYPEQNIATLNYVQFPEDRPVTFTITSDAPMNSFWIPQLGGQIYAMSGMSTKLHLLADQPGSYRGLSANISGTGFADMAFTAESTTQDNFDNWVRMVQQSAAPLDMTTYTTLAQPSKDFPRLTYSPVQDKLYDEIVDQFMEHRSRPHQPKLQIHSTEHY